MKEFTPMSDYQLNATSRTDTGTRNSRRLRHAGEVPGVVYGANQPAVNIGLDHNKLWHAFENEGYFSSLINLKISQENDSKEEQVIIKKIQRHPYEPRILHIDFQRIDNNKKIRTRVPLTFSDEEKAPGSKKGGVISYFVSDTEVICLPSQLPTYIAVDVSKLDTAESIYLSDLVLPEGVALTALSRGDDQNQAVAAMSKPISKS
jgi:large subunit ribosomal protein L25